MFDGAKQKEYGFKALSAPCKLSFRTGVKLCKKVDRTSMLKSREYDETKQMLLSIEENQKEYGGKARWALCKLFLANRSETLSKGRLYVNDEVKRL